MSCLELNECEKRSEIVNRGGRGSGSSGSGGVNTLVTKMQAQKLSVEPKWTNIKKSENLTEFLNTDQENFLTKGAFLLTPSYELSMERASMIFEKMNFKGCFSLTKTATGILFKFSHPDDYQVVFKKGFHKVTGARFYRKIVIPCRPRKTFTLFVLEVPEDLPCEDIRHALYKFESIVEVVRLYVNPSCLQSFQHHYQTHYQSSTVEGTTSASSASSSTGVDAAGSKTSSSMDSSVEKINPIEHGDRKDTSHHQSPMSSVIRITLASMDEYNLLLQSGLNFYDATFFPTEANIVLKGAKIDQKRSGWMAGRVHELLPVFDAAGFCKLPAPACKVLKPQQRF